MSEDKKAVPFWEEQEENAASSLTTQEHLAKYVEEALGLKSEMKNIEDDLEAKKERLVLIVRELIPTLMDELGTSIVKTADGVKIDVEKKANASIKEENKPAAHAWLQANGFGGLIKANLSVEFGREEIEQAQELCQQLREQELEATLKEGVHTGTLKSFVQEQLQAGTALPDSISVFEFREAKITLPKKKK